MYCRSCAAELAEKAVACTKCGRRPYDGNKFCPNCGKETQEGAVICTSCGVALKAGGAATGEKSPVIAGILNWLWSGVGNIYLGQKTKGVVFCVITSFLIILDIVTCSLGAIIHVPYMIIMIIDAVLLANRIGRGESIAEWKFF